MKRGNFARGAAKLLAVRGLIDPKETQDLLGQVGQESGFLDLLIKSQPGLRERVILSALASAAGCQFLTSDQLDSEEKALRELQQDVASRIPALPIEIQESSLVIAVENPFNVEMMEDLELLTSRSIVPKMALRSAVLQALETAYADLDEDVPMLEPPSLARPEGADEQILSGVGEYEETMVAPPEVQQMLEQQHERQQQMLAQQKTAEDAPKGEGDEESTPAAEDEEGGASEVNPTEAACAADTAGTEKQLKVAGPQIGDPGSADEPEEARGCAAAEGEPNAEPRGTTGQPQPPEVDREPGGASEVDREPEAAPPTEQDVEEASGVESALVAAVQSVPVSAGGTEYPPDRSPTGGAGRLARQATVRYYGQMTPHQSFPLTTVIAVAQVPPPLEASGQATGGLSSMAGPAGSRLVLRPCFPGCISVPAEQMLDARSEQTTLDFWITPLVDGELADARLEVHRGEELLDVIPLPSRVVRTTWAKIALGAGILLPIIGVVFDMFGLEPRGNALARLIANSGGVLVSSLLAAAGLIVVSLCLSWVIRPKQATAQSALI